MTEFESADAPVTVVRPRASRRSQVTSVLLVVVVVVLGDLLELLAYLFAPIAKIPAVRRRLEKDDAVPDHLEVRADSVTAVGSQAGRVIRRVSRAVLTVRDIKGSPALHIAGTADPAATIDLSNYDVDEVGSTVLAHGWPWQPAGGAVTYPPPPLPATPTADSPRVAGGSTPVPGAGSSAPDFEVVLRDGWTRPIPSKAVLVLVFVGVGLGLVGYLVAAIAGVRGGWLMATVLGAAVLVALCVIAIAVVWTRFSRLTFVVGRERLVVTYGAVSKLVVHRRSVVSAVPGRRSVRVREQDRRRSTYLPVGQKRRELVTALVAYGWPVSGGG